MSAAGLQVWDEAGRVVMDSTTRLGLAIGVLQTGTSNGSYSDARLLGGSPFIIVSPDSMGLTISVPVVTVSGQTVSWTFPASSHSRANARVTYGIQ